ncbi:MAG: hypothetical protein ACOVLE_05395 [Pirellula staleyi]
MSNTNVPPSEISMMAGPPVLPTLKMTSAWAVWTRLNATIARKILFIIPTPQFKILNLPIRDFAAKIGRNTM